MKESYTLDDAIETCKNIVVRHRGKSLKTIIDLAIAQVKVRLCRSRLPKGWRENLENAIIEELEIK